MISLRLLTLILLTLGCRQWAQANHVPAPWTAGLSVLGVALGFGLMFKMAALRLLSYSFYQVAGVEATRAGQVYSIQQCSRTRNFIEAAWVGCLPLALLVTGWGATLVSMREAGLPQAIELLGWFMPSLFLLVLLELTSAQFHVLSYEGKWEEPTTKGQYCQLPYPSMDEMVLSWPREFVLRLRLGEMASLLMCLAPVVLLALANDIVQYCIQYCDRYFAQGWLASQVMLAAMVFAMGCAVLCLPFWLSRWMGAGHFPDGVLRERIESQLRQLKIRGVEPRLLRSGGRWPGAAIVGWLPGFRQLWLGDALIDRLTSQQVDMVVMHELAHVIRRHFLWRVFPIFGAVCVVVFFGVFWPEAEQWKLVGTLVSSLAACLVMLAGMSSMAHRCEIDADLTACSLAEQACGWARENPLLARQELAAALTELLRDCPQAAAASWLHPSLVQRLKNLGCDSRR